MRCSASVKHVDHMSIALADPYRPAVEDTSSTSRALALVVLDRPSVAGPDEVWRWGRSSVSPFTLGPDRTPIALASGGLAGIVRHRRWAVMATDPIAPPGLEDATLDETLEQVAAQRLRPVFACVADTSRYLDRGMWSTPIADDALIDLMAFTLSGSRMANLRHSVASARRAGLTVRRWSRADADAASAVSARWLATKRGGEMGFTLGRFDPSSIDHLDGRVAVDERGCVVAMTTWLRFDGGKGRVLDLMRRVPDAPSSAMDLLIAESLESFRAEGVNTVSLGSVPRSHGSVAERVYPTASLRRYKEKFAPRWESRHLVAPARRHLPAAMSAIAHAYNPSGLIAAVRSNR